MSASVWAKRLNIDLGWARHLAPLLESESGKSLMAAISARESAGVNVYPPKEQRLRALRDTPFDKVRVVILGQDPYHTPGAAVGLAFSVPRGRKLQPSVRNIYKELVDDVGIPMPKHGDLSPWTKEGVLLLNTSLTVEEGKPGSHSRLGWSEVTDALIDALSTERKHLVFLLWGSHANEKAARVDRSRHLVLSAPHPSPMSARRGFFGCRHFSQANAYLEAHGIEPVSWLLPD